MVNQIAYVKGVGQIVETRKNFYEELIEFQEAGARLITPSQEMKVRIRTAGEKNIGKSYGTWTTVGFQSIKEELPLLRLNSRLLNPKLARQAVEANRDNKYFSTQSTKEYEQSLTQAEKEKDREPWKKQILVLPSRDNFDITPEENFEVLQFLARNPKLAEDYFKFHGSHPITTYLVDKNTVDAQDGTLETQLWFDGLGDRSVFSGDVRGLDYDGARGVLKSSAKPTRAEEKQSKVHQVRLPYTNKQLDRFLETATGIKEGRLGTSQAGKLEEFILGLKQSLEQ